MKLEMGSCISLNKERKDRADAETHRDRHRDRNRPEDRHNEKE